MTTAGLHAAGAGMADATSGSQEHPEAGLGLEVLLDTPAAPAAEDSRDPLLCSALAAAVKQPHGLDRTCSNSTSGSIRSPPARSLTSSSLSSSNSTSRGVVASLGALPHHSPASSLQPSLPSCEHLPNSTNHADQACPALHTHQQQAGQAPLRPYNWAPEKRARSVFFARVPPAVGEEELAALFSSVGHVEEVHLFKAFPRCRLSKGCGVVVYTSTAQADMARTNLHGRCFWASSRNTLVVDPVKAADQVQCSSSAAAGDGAGGAGGAGVDALPTRGTAAAAAAAGLAPGACSMFGRSGAISSASGAGRQASATAGGPSGRWLHHKAQQGQQVAGGVATFMHHPGLQQVLGVEHGASGTMCFLPQGNVPAAAGGGLGPGQLSSMAHLLPPVPAQQQQQQQQQHLGQPGVGPLLAPPARPAADAAWYMYAAGPDGALQLVQAGGTLLPAAAGEVTVYGAGGAAHTVARQSPQAHPPVATAAAAVGGSFGGMIDTGIGYGSGFPAYAPPGPNVAAGSLQGVGLGQQAGWAGPQGACLQGFSDLQQVALAHSTSQAPVLATPWQQQAWQQQQQQLVAAQQQALMAQQQVAQPQQPQLMVVPAQEVGPAAGGMYMPATPPYPQQQQQQLVAGMQGVVPPLAQQVAGFNGVPLSAGLPQLQHMQLVGGQPAMVGGPGVTAVSGQLVFVPGLSMQP